MQKIILFLMLGTFMVNVPAVSAETIVRHERTHFEYQGAEQQAQEETKAEPAVQEEVVPAVQQEVSPAEPESKPAEAVKEPNPVPAEAKPAANADEIVVYGPWAPMERKEAPEQSKPASSAEKFLGTDTSEQNPWFRQGSLKGFFYRDCIYMAGGEKDKEDYIVALRRQTGKDGEPVGYCSLLVFVGRGQSGQLSFIPEKLPVLSWGAEAADKQAFTSAWVKQPESYMLRMDRDVLKKILTSGSAELQVETNSGAKSIKIPAEVIKAWDQLLESTTVITKL